MAVRAHFALTAHTSMEKVEVDTGEYLLAGKIHRDQLYSSPSDLGGHAEPPPCKVEPVSEIIHGVRENNSCA